ncbi:MAG TPA: hypothetical protein VKU92_13820 [Acidimicrobiales bacterium]|nr:hypothetical protein [Acidimicrobiales bacterium]
MITTVRVATGSTSSSPPRRPGRRVRDPSLGGRTRRGWSLGTVVSQVTLT